MPTQKSTIFPLAIDCRTRTVYTLRSPTVWLSLARFVGGFLCLVNYAVRANETELSAEMAIHFSGLKNLDKHGVWVFANFLVCLDRGCSHFTVSEEKLASIAHTLGSPTPGSSAGCRGVQ